MRVAISILNSRASESVQATPGECLECGNVNSVLCPGAPLALCLTFLHEAGGTRIVSVQERLVFDTFKAPHVDAYVLGVVEDWVGLRLWDLFRFEH